MTEESGQEAVSADSRLPQGPFAGTVINVKDHGALGDGTTEDTGALEAAIKASDEGDALYFPVGVYVVERRLTPKAGQLYFSLTGRATLKARQGLIGFPMFVVRSGPVEFRHLIIDGNKDQTAKPSDPDVAAGIWRPADVLGPVDIVVSACRIENVHDDGIRIAGGKARDRTSDRVIVRDTVVVDWGMNGLGFGRIDNVRVDSSRFERCHSGIKMLNCHDVVVHAVTANANRRHGIVFTFSHRWHVDNCVAAGNGSPDDGGWGIAAGGEPIDLDPNSEFTITNNICENNADGGITVDPTTAPAPDEPEVIWSQRARVSGNVCRNATLHHGIHLTHARDVVVTDNVCEGNERGSGIQLVSSSHVLVQGNTCFANRNGIGLFSNAKVTSPGHHAIGINMLYGNESDVFHQATDRGQPLAGVRIHGLHGERPPERRVQAEPGTLYEWHEADRGALFVKESGSGTTGWVRVAADDSV